MTDYNDGQWHGWNGGECPVHSESVIKYELRCGDVRTAFAGNLVWACLETVNDIINFRVVKKYCEPREWWIVFTDGAPMIFNNEQRAKLYAKEYGFNATHVIEAIK